MKLAIIGMLAIAMQQRPERIQSLRDAMLFGGFGPGFSARQLEAINDPAAAARWKELERRAENAMSRLRPPPDHSGLISMVWGKRQHYERLFIAVSSPSSTRDAELWIAEEVTDFVGGMRPCYEWSEGGAECPKAEAEFAEFWLRRHPRSAFAAFLPLFAGHRWTCVAEMHDSVKEASDVAAARERATRLLKQAASAEDPLFRYVARQVLADPKCFVTVN